MKRTKEERRKLCGDLYAGENSRNFMLHMIRAYAKLDLIKPVVEFREKQRHKCAICDVKLLSMDDAIKTASENSKEMTDAVIADVKLRLNGVMPAEHPLAKFYKGQTLAYEGDSTDTCVCVECAVAINEFTTAMILNGDRGVNRTVSSMLDKQNVVVKEERKEHRNVQATQSLADAPGFSKLLEVFKK